MSDQGMEMRRIEEVGERTNALVVDFLVIDWQMAITFLDQAEDASAREEDPVRRFHAANKAYETIVKFLARANLSREQYDSLMIKLTRLHKRLDRHLATYEEVA